MLKWSKHGLIFDAVAFEGRDWLKAFAQAPSVLIFDEFVRVYFSCRPDPDENGQYCSYSAFVDLNRRDLTEVLRVSENPILPLGDIGTFDEFGTYPVSAIRMVRMSARIMQGGRGARVSRSIQLLAPL